MGEAVRKYNGKLHIEHLSCRKGEQLVRQYLYKVYAMIHDSRVMIRSDEKTTLAELESSLPFISGDQEAPEVRVTSKSFLQKDMLKVGEEGFRSLCRCVDEKFR